MSPALRRPQAERKAQARGTILRSLLQVREPGLSSYAAWIGWMMYMTEGDGPQPGHLPCPPEETVFTQSCGDSSCSVMLYGIAASLLCHKSRGCSRIYLAKLGYLCCSEFFRAS